MKFTYKLLSLGLAIACLSGCNAANTEIASSSAATATVTPTTDSTEVPASNNVFTSAGDGLYVTTDSGIYELQTVFPDSANIFYTHPINICKAAFVPLEMISILIFTRLMIAGTSHISCGM